MLKTSKFSLVTLFLCLSMISDYSLAETCKDRALNFVWNLASSPRLIAYVAKAEKINAVKLSEIDSYMNLAAYLEDANKLASYGDLEQISKNNWDYNDFKSVCSGTFEKSKAELNKFFVLYFVNLEYKEFIRNRNPESYPPRSEAVSKIRLDLSNETVLFKFKGYEDALNYISKAATRILSAKDDIVVNIETKAKEQEEGAAKKSKELNELKIKVELEKERQSELARIEAEKNALLKELQETRNSTSQNQGSSSQSAASNNSTRGDGYLKKGGVFCTSEASFDRQVELLARAQSEYSNGCYSVNQNVQAWLKDSRLFSGTCVIELVESRQVIWTFCEDYESN
jgi:hypothetical protein